MTAQASKGTAVITNITQQVRKIGTVGCVTTVAPLLLTVAARFIFGWPSAPSYVLLVLAEVLLIALLVLIVRALSAARRRTPRAAVASGEDDGLVTYEVMAQTLPSDTRRVIEVAVRWEGERHGTVSAYIEHRRAHERVCDPCFQAWEDARGKLGFEDWARIRALLATDQVAYHALFLQAVTSHRLAGGRSLDVATGQLTRRPADGGRPGLPTLADPY